MVSERRSCTSCGHTIDLEQKKKQQEQVHTGDTGTGAVGGGVVSVDGLSDSQTRPNRGATKFRSMDPRSRFLSRKKSDIDPELERILYDQGATLVSYNERVEEDGQTLSSDNLRANK
jgi:hypothetical protein